MSLTYEKVGNSKLLTDQTFYLAEHQVDKLPLLEKEGIVN